MSPHSLVLRSRDKHPVTDCVLDRYPRVMVLLTSLLLTGLLRRSSSVCLERFTSGFAYTMNEWGLTPSCVYLFFHRSFMQSNFAQSDITALLHWRAHWRATDKKIIVGFWQGLNKWMIFWLINQCNIILMTRFYNLNFSGVLHAPTTVQHAYEVTYGWPTIYIE